MNRFRFLHAADIHLDSPLRGLEGHESRITARIRSAPRAALENLIARAVSERVDFLVIAGDLYDGSWKDYRTGLFFAEAMGRLHREAIPVFLLYGNHDAESQITRPLRLPENVHVFSSRKPQTFTLDDVPVALHGQSFRERAVTENLVPAYPSPRADMFNIGVLHTGLGGMPGHDNYAPCSLAELTAKGYGYWALGHIHQRQVLHERPHVVFPGNLQGRHVRETGPKGAFLVTVEDREVTELEPLDLDVVRWSVINVDVKDAETLDEVVESLLAAMKTEVTRADGRLLVCRLRLRGKSPIHSRLVTDLDHLLQDARAASFDLGDDAVWVDRIVLETRPMTDAAAIRAREDALGDLVRMVEEAPADEKILETLRKELGLLADRLPHEVRETVEDPALRALLDGDYPALIREATPWLVARLTAGED